MSNKTKTRRREFLKKTGLGVAVAGLSGWNGVVEAVTAADSSAFEAAPDASEETTSGWTFTFDEHASLLSLQNGAASLSGKLTFASGIDTWKVTRSRDGVADRYALVDPQDNVQGYFVFLPDGNGIQLLFYHRTAQSYKGVWSWDGEIRFTEDSFACRIRPEKASGYCPCVTDRRIHC